MNHFATHLSITELPSSPFKSRFIPPKRNESYRNGTSSKISVQMGSGTKFRLGYIGEDYKCSANTLTGRLSFCEFLPAPYNLLGSRNRVVLGRALRTSFEWRLIGENLLNIYARTLFQKEYTLRLLFYVD